MILLRCGPLLKGTRRALFPKRALRRRTLQAAVALEGRSRAATAQALRNPGKRLRLWGARRLVRAFFWLSARFRRRFFHAEQRRTSIGGIGAPSRRACGGHVGCALHSGRLRG